MVKPRRLRPGDVVGVAATSGPIDAARLEAGLAVLGRFGLRPRVGDAVLERRAYLAGSDAARLADLTVMLGDPEVRAVFCARGGYGSQRIVPSLDLDVLRADPKPVIGYSDVTALHGLLARAGVASFHGPMVASDMARGLTAGSTTALWSAVSDPDARLEVPVPTPIRPGPRARLVVGGCLSVLVSTLGTPWAVDTAGAVLFLEDVHEWPYRLDRLLLQLGQAGKLDRVAGVVFGTMASCPETPDATALDVVREAFAEAPFPVGFGLPSGHDPSETEVENLTLPLGVVVELDVDAGRLVALEPAVV